MHTAQWDIFCRVIDNYGDIGVCWRLTAELAARGHQVRLWVDDAAALAWMAPGAQQGRWSRITVCDWRMASDPERLSDLVAADVWVEAFGCEIPLPFVAQRVAASVGEPFPAWINLEYLSAESFAERAHRLPSLVMHGPAKGLTKHFFYPGFSASTGGLLRENDLAQRQAEFDRAGWLATLGIHLQEERLVSLFCYEPIALGELVRVWQKSPFPTRLLVTHGRAQAAILTLPAALKSLGRQAGGLRIDFLPPMSQSDFDHLLWTCDLNFVRGEDSVVRAVWSGKPFIWQIYPQHDNAHHAKLAAFLDVLNAPPSLRRAHAIWNGTRVDAMPDRAQQDWEAWATQTRGSLWAQSDLTTRLVEFTESVRRSSSQKIENR